jgi:hypothetical protein
VSAARVGRTIVSSTCFLDALVEGRDGRVASHPAGVRASIAVEHGLVVLGRGQRQGIAPVRQDEEGDLLADHELLDDHARPGETEGAALHALGDRCVGVLQSAADDRALAGRETVGLHDQRRAELAAVAARVGGLIEAREPRRRDPARDIRLFENTLEPSIAAARALGRRRSGPRRRACRQGRPRAESRDRRP